MTASLFDRSDYPTLRGSVYLNQASLGLIGQPSVAAMHAFLDGVARHGNLYLSDTDEVSLCDAIRESSSRLLHADKQQVAIVTSASEILGQLPFLFKRKLNSTVVVVSSDFPAITRPWLRQAALNNCRLQFVYDTAERDLTETLVDAIDDTTGVVAVSNVQYATGSSVDVFRLRQSTAQVGARLIVDATQAAGAINVDATGWAADMVVASGYKWLGGHGGVALAVLSRDLLEEIPAFPGWMGAPDPFAFDATSLSMADGARRYTQSTMSYVSIVGLEVSIRQLLLLGEARIEAHARRLASMLVEEASKYGWQPFRSIVSETASPHIVSLGHPSRNAAATLERLRGRNIVCSVRGGCIRVSLAPYNDVTDVCALIEALGSTED